MSFLLSRIFGSSVARTTETQAARTGSSGILTKVAVGGIALSVADPILNSLSKIPGVGQVFQPAAGLANSSLGLAQSGIQGASGAFSGIGDILSNPIYLLAGGGILLFVLMKK